MGAAFTAYIELLELTAFFSGYVLLYFIVVTFTAKPLPEKVMQKKFPSFLPLAYALTGTFYLGLQLKNLYPDYSISNITQSFHMPFLKTWGLLTVLFWIPALYKKTLLSLLHSLVFFFFLLKDIWMYATSNMDNDIIKNDMKLFTVSLLINSGSLLIISFAWYLKKRVLKK